MLRVVLDTNTVLSALLWGGTPGQLITIARAGEIVLCSSQVLLDELQGVIHREKFTKSLATRDLRPGTLFDGYAALCQIVQPQPLTRTSIDPDDDQVLATALAARAHLIVSGDRKHLLVLERFAGIPIVTATQAITMIQTG